LILSNFSLQNFANLLQRYCKAVAVILQTNMQCGCKQYAVILQTICSGTAKRMQWVCSEQTETE